MHQVADGKPIWSVSIAGGLGLLAVAYGTVCDLYRFSPASGEMRLLQRLDTPHTKTIRRVSIKPSSSREYPTLALCSFDGTCSIFGAEGVDGEWEMLAVLEGHENEIKSVDWSADGRYLATCGRDKSVWVWETDDMNEEFECIEVVNDHQGDVKQVRWAPRGHRFVSCGYDDCFKIYQLNAGDDSFDCVCSVDVGSTVWDAVWLDDDRVVVALDDGRILAYRRQATDVSGGTIKQQEQWALVKETTVSQSPVYALARTSRPDDDHDDCDEEVVVAVGAAGQVCFGDERIAVSPTLAELNCVAACGPFVVCGDDRGQLSVLSVQ